MIRTTAQLEKICKTLQTQKFITVDTEFIREKTFYPQLCLVQIGAEKKAWVIDALSPDMNLVPLFEVFLNKNVIKVFHACRQDLEIFYHLMHRMPIPVFDTQVGAMVCGYSDNIAYQRLVEDYLGIKLDKGMRVTDWAHRPLTKEQEKYALHDVVELKEVYTKMMDEICKSNRLDWIQEEMQNLVDPKAYELDAVHLMDKMRLPFQDAGKIHMCARLCEWREELAKKMNLPRQYILSDNALIECAVLKSQKKADFNRLRSRSLSDGFMKSEIGKSLLSVCQKVAKEEVKEWPIKKHYIIKPNQKNQIEALRLLLNAVCEEAHVAPHLVASTDDLLSYLIDSSNVRFMQGWRYQIFGKKVKDLMAGKLAFFYDSHKRSLVVRSV